MSDSRDSREATRRGPLGMGATSGVNSVGSLLNAGSGVIGETSFLGVEVSFQMAMIHVLVEVSHHGGDHAGPLSGTSPISRQFATSACRVAIESTRGTRH